MGKKKKSLIEKLFPTKLFPYRLKTTIETNIKFKDILKVDKDAFTQTTFPTIGKYGWVRVKTKKVKRNQRCNIA